MDDPKVEGLIKQVSDLEAKLLNLERILSTHTHRGNDGSDFIFNDSIKLKPGQSFEVGSFGLTEYNGAASDGSTIQQGLIVVGLDDSLVNGFENTQLIIEHQPETDSTSIAAGTNQSFFHALRGRAYLGSDGVVSSSGTTMTTTQYNFGVNELAGLLLSVYDPLAANAGQFDVYEIASNTANAITITGGTWTFSGTNCSYQIHIPVYLGSAINVWRRVYTGDGSGGGIRFGYGDTNGAQNGLLYMSGQDLKWRQPDGTVTTVTVT